MQQDLASITIHIHNWLLFLLWFHPFILSGVIYPVISSSILGTYRPGEFPFQYSIILPFHTVHGVLKERILKWFSIPFSSGPHFVGTLHHDPSILGAPTQHGSQLTVKDELPRSVGVQYATIKEWRNNSKKNEETEPKQKQHPAVDVTGGGSKV